MKILGICLVKLSLTYGDPVYINSNHIVGIRLVDETTTAVDTSSANIQYTVKGTVKQVVDAVNKQCGVSNR